MPEEEKYETDKMKKEVIIIRRAKEPLSFDSDTLKGWRNDILPRLHGYSDPLNLTKKMLELGPGISRLEYNGMWKVPDSWEGIWTRGNWEEHEICCKNMYKGMKLSCPIGPKDPAPVFPCARGGDFSIKQFDWSCRPTQVVFDEEFYAVSYTHLTLPTIYSV